MASYIGRRKFLATLLGGTAVAAWPLAAHAQQAQGLITSARTAFLGAESASTNRNFFDAFRQRMREHGYVDRQTSRFNLCDRCEYLGTLAVR